MKSKRGYRHLNVNDRRLIGILHKQRVSIRQIAKRLQVAPSTISRELKRNWSFGYCCFIADSRAKSRRSRLNRERMKITPERGWFVVDQIRKRHSPEQIAAEFEQEFGVPISTVSIYRWIYRYHGGGRYNLTQWLRHGGRKYRKYSGSSRLSKRPMIDARPKSVQTRHFYGDWEADLMEGPRTSMRSLLVLVERKSGYVRIRKVEDRTSATVSKAIIEALKGYRVRTITYDNGAEFAQYERVAAKTKSRPYFCRPYHAWEKGLVENTIGLLRQYFPKNQKEALSEDYRVYREVEIELNQRPRKRLAFQTPECYRKSIIR